MQQFPGEQRAFCVRSYYETNSYVTVRRRFRVRYGLHDIQQAPSANLIKHWVQKFERSGSTVNSKPVGRRRTVRTPVNIDRVHASVRQHPRRSIRKRAAAMNLHRSSVQRILQNDLRFHAYKIQIVQALKATDYPLRLAFAREMLLQFENFDDMFFSDEAHFHLDGYVNRQNMRYWAETNPREKHQEHLHSPKVTVWAAISATGIIGPYFFEDNHGRALTVNSERYTAMIRNFFGPALQEWDGYGPTTWFQQDGATSHTSRVALEALRELFLNRLISRRGDINWPPRSPDLTPPDFFLWGYLKHRVYMNPPTTLRQLKARIREEIAAIGQDMCQRVFTQLRSRLEECQRRDGRHLDDVIFHI